MEQECNGRRARKRMIYALGELLIDLIPAEGDMLLEDGGSVIKTASGSSGIFACAAQLLGGNAGFIGKIGQDPLSRMAEKTIRAQGVNLDQVIVSEEGQIGLAFVEYTPQGRHYQYYRRDSVGSRLRAEEIKEDAIQHAYAVHYSGMLLELNPEMRGACQRLTEIAHAKGVLVSFDPNIRQEVMAGSAARDRLLEAVQGADILSPTLEEGRTLTGEQTVGAVIRALHAMGPRVVALTMDKDGAVISRDGTAAIAKGIDCPAVDPTGAGDTLAAALCVGMRESMELQKLAAFCNCAGTLVITRRGAIGMALPTRTEVEALMASSDCQVREVPLEELV